MKKTFAWFGAAFLAAGIAAACGGGAKKAETTPVAPMAADAGAAAAPEAPAPTSMTGNPCSAGGEKTASGNPCSK